MILFDREKRRPEFLNAELKSYLGVQPQSESTSPVAAEPSTSVTAEGFLCTNSDWMSPLDLILDSHNTLRSVVESSPLSDGIDTVSYSMKHSKTGRVYEVRTKHAADSEITVVKDQTLYEQLVREKQLEKYLRMLLASITHEIRNPLNVIEGCSELLSDTCHQVATMLHHSAQSINYIVKGACYLVRSEGESLGRQEEFFAVRDSVERVVAMNGAGVEGRNVILDYALDDNVPKCTILDRRKYELILFHLVKNAVKYTSVGRVHISVSYDPMARAQMTTTVSDTGCGIRLDVIGRLFTLYANLDTANVNNPQGMGLGLVLCRRLARVLGGEVEVHSKLGEGSSFAFSVCCARIEVNKAPAGEEEEIPLERSLTREVSTEICMRRFEHKRMDASCVLPTRGCKCRSVLVVDDEFLNRMVIKSYLKGLGEVPEEAENGLVGLNKVKQRSACVCCHRYKLILMDINMPVMDGTQSTKEIALLFAREGIDPTPVVAITAANMESQTEIQELHKAGFRDICKCP